MRQVFRLLVERRDERSAAYSGHFRISAPKLRRIYQGGDLEGDPALLSESYLLDLNKRDDQDGPEYWRISFPGRKDSFHLLFAEYVVHLRLDLSKPLVLLDFSDF